MIIARDFAKRVLFRTGRMPGRRARVISGRCGARPEGGLPRCTACSDGEEKCARASVRRRIFADRVVPERGIIFTATKVGCIKIPRRHGRGRWWRGQGGDGGRRSAARGGGGWKSVAGTVAVGNRSDAIMCKARTFTIRTPSVHEAAAAVVYIILRPGRNLGMENGPLYIISFPYTRFFFSLLFAFRCTTNLILSLFFFVFVFFSPHHPGIKRSFLFIGRRFNPLLSLTTFLAIPFLWPRRGRDCFSIGPRHGCIYFLFF